MKFVVGRSYMIRSRDAYGYAIEDISFPSRRIYYCYSRRLRPNTAVEVIAVDYYSHPELFVEPVRLVKDKAADGRIGWIRPRYLKRMTDKDRRMQYAMKYL